jgi:hypothetical protein
MAYTVQNFWERENKDLLFSYGCVGTLVVTPKEALRCYLGASVRSLFLGAFTYEKAVLVCAEKPKNI